MTSDNVTKAEEYYKFIGEKNAEEVEKYLSPEVTFCSPLMSLKGKKAVLEATCNFMNVIQSLKIRSSFGAKDEAAIVYSVDIPGLSDNFSGVSLLTFRDELIVSVELFFDASSFSQKRV